MFSEEEEEYADSLNGKESNDLSRISPHTSAINEDSVSSSAKEVPNTKSVETKQTLPSETVSANNNNDLTQEGKSDDNVTSEQISVITTPNNNGSIGGLETSLLLTDPPSGFKDSISETLQPLSEQTQPNQAIENNSVTPTGTKSPPDEAVSVSSESFDQAVNTRAAAQESTDEDTTVPACTYNSLPNLSQTHPIASGFIEKEFNFLNTTMPEQKAYKQSTSSGPMHFSIAGYTERSNTETPYTEKLRIGRSDSNVSAYNSPLRYYFTTFRGLY